MGYSAGSSNDAEIWDLGWRLRSTSNSMANEGVADTERAKHGYLVVNQEPEARLTRREQCLVADPDECEKWVQQVR